MNQLHYCPQQKCITYREGWVHKSFLTGEICQLGDDATDVTSAVAACQESLTWDRVPSIRQVDIGTVGARRILRATMEHIAQGNYPRSSGSMTVVEGLSQAPITDLELAVANLVLDGSGWTLEKHGQEDFWVIYLQREP